MSEEIFERLNQDLKGFLEKSGFEVRIWAGGKDLKPITETKTYWFFNENKSFSIKIAEIKHRK